MYTPGQIIKITPTERNHRRKYLTGGMTVTIIGIEANMLYVKLDADDAKNPVFRGRDEIGFVFEDQDIPAFYPEWTIEIIDTPIIKTPSNVAPKGMEIEESKVLAEKFEVGWSDPRETGMMHDQPQPASYIIHVPETGWERTSKFEMNVVATEKLTDTTNISVTLVDDSRRDDYVIQEAMIIDDSNQIVEYLTWNQIRLVGYDGDERRTTFSDLWGVMTPGEAAKTFDLAEATVRQAINRGQIPSRKSGGTWLILRKDAETRWAKK